MSARTAIASSATEAASSVHGRLEAAYAAYDSSAIARALMTVQAATGDWVAERRLSTAA